MINRIISFLLFLIFGMFAYVQVNDPDPVLWVIAYLIVAAVCLARAFNYSWKYINLTIHIGFVIASFFFVGGVWEWLITENKSELFGEMVYKKPYIEETREFLGLTIAAIAMFYQYKVARN
ncbi:MAG: transmembrane 220 family protein [Cyclobacteriaceae bacterium]